MSWLPYITMFLLMVVGLFMIFIILLQRGRGGGLAGALGGMGGTSAFGTRAGDVFTRITIVVAVIWTVLAAVNVWVLSMNTTRFKGGSQAVPTAPALEAKPGRQDTSSPAEEEPSDTTTPQTEPAGQTPAEVTSPANTPSDQQTNSSPASAGENPPQE